MSRQTRNIYYTGNDILDRILESIASRLDIIEGLRPDQGSGFYTLEDGKIIITKRTDQLADELLTALEPLLDLIYYRIKAGIAINDLQIEVIGGNVEVENGIVKVTVGTDAGSIEVYDVNGDLIHKME
jgi:hypothetical protein